MSERIAVITTSYPRQPGDAAGHFVQSEVKQLLRAGHEVHVFVPGGANSSDDGATLHGLADRGAFGWPGALVRLKERPARVLGAGEFCVRAGAALRRHGRFTRLQAHFLVPCAWPIAASVESSTELELIGHGSDVRLFCRLPKLLRRRIASAWLARRAQLRVTSQELADLVRSSNPELANSLRVAASPIDVLDVPSRSAARAALGIAEAKPLALVVARLIPEKRVPVALRALALLDELSTVVVGDGPDLPALRARFPNVHFTGHLPRSETLRWIAAADVVVSGSAQEGAPTVVREARALGVPVVAIAAGDLATRAGRDGGILLVTPSRS